MDLKKYDELRKKINTKDFEGNNKGLDRWLYRFSFVGNASAIFFAYFLVFPALLKTISLHFFGGFWGALFAIVFTLIFLTIFEIVKRYLIRNFSSDYVSVHKKINAPAVGWLIISLTIIALSFYLSISGSKNLATTSFFKNTLVESEISIKTDSLSTIYEKEKRIFENDNENLRNINNDLRQKLTETPFTYRTIRNDYQTSIDKNVKIIAENQTKINEINNTLNFKIKTLNEQLTALKSTNQTEDTKNIFLFVIIVIFNELIIIGGIYFREYFEFTLYEINHQKFEKIYQKKDRYLALLAFVYGDGKLTTGDKVISGLELKTLVAEKTNISNSANLVKNFLQDMDRLGIFATTGKRRYIVAPFHEAKNIVEKFDEAFRVLENMK